MGRHEARNVGGMRRRTGRKVCEFDHYLTDEEAEKVSARANELDLERGIIRRWNGRKPTPELLSKSKTAVARRKRRLRKLQQPSPSTQR